MLLFKLKITIILNIGIQRFSSCRKWWNVKSRSHSIHVNFDHDLSLKTYSVWLCHFLKNSVKLWELATLQSQSVRRNTLYQRSSISWNESCVHLGVISFWLIGFGIAFGEGSPYIGLTNFAGYGLGFRNHAMLFFQVSTIAYRNYGIIIFFHEVKLTNGKNFRF